VDAYRFLDILEGLGGTFFSGVPDSLLSPFIDAVAFRYGISDKHIVAANEGAAVGLAAGHYLAASRPAVVYMQNSGLGNAVNPICSLLNEKVYSIPVIFVIGWRGEPGTKDEPQHVYQGEVTLPMLDLLDIPYAAINSETEDLNSVLQNFRQHLERCRPVAFVVSKGAINIDQKITYASDASLSREEALNVILDDASTDSDTVFVCTTGKLSREVFEIREQRKECHERDFLTVGSMGHSLMIACGIAFAKPDKWVFCLDGDGAMLMHMGSLAVAGVHKPQNLVHVVINNGAHETVGGLPAVSAKLDLREIAASFRYSRAFRVDSKAELSSVLSKLESIVGPVFIEVLCNLSSRADLGRPSTTPIENKDSFMSFLSGTEKSR